MSDRVILSAPDVSPLEETYVLDAIRSGWIAPLGPDVDAFEREIAARVNVREAVAVNSGTAGLHLSLLCLGVRPGDPVIVPSLTFAATANAAIYAGATPVFVDCDLATGNIDVDLLAATLRQLRRKNTPARAVVTVDLFGHCADYASIIPLCAELGAPVVEDAAEALGSRYRGQAAGSFGDVAVLSFNGNKILTTSGGGMVLCDDAKMADRARYLASQARQPVPHYEHTEIGYNYRLSNLLAALGRAQLRRLDEMIARRQLLRNTYAGLFADVAGVRLLSVDDREANCWLTAIVVDPAVAGWHASDLARYLDDRGIETRPVWKPMHLQPVFANAPCVLTGAAEQLFRSGLVLPSGSALRPDEIDRVGNTIAEFVCLDGRLQDSIRAL